MLRRYGLTEVETAAESDEELALLLGVTRDLSDPLPKLVYADWLEERDDPRGPFLREFVTAAQDPKGELPENDELPWSWQQAVGILAIARIRYYLAENGFVGTAKQVKGIERELLRQARPTAYLTVVPHSDAKIPHGQTKYGGRPDLPQGTPWPQLPVPDSSEMRVGVFCAQVNLSDLHGTLVGQELPESGLLSFSFDPMAWAAHVRCHPANSSWYRPEPPEGKRSFPPEFYPLPAGALRIVEGLDLPCHARKLWPKKFYARNWEVLGYLWDDLQPDPDADSRPHQLLGYGFDPNCSPPPDEKPGVRRLATFPHDSNSPWYWGDNSQPYFFVRDADLTLGRFDLVEYRPG